MSNAKPNYCQKGGVECLDAIKAATEGLTGYEGFLIGSVIKYCWRWNKKDGVADLRKATVYIQRLIETRATKNRPYTLDELRALPEGAQVWVEVCGSLADDATTPKGWHEKDSGGKLRHKDSPTRFWPTEGTGMHGRWWRAWPAEPTPEQSEAWPCGNGGGK